MGRPRVAGARRIRSNVTRFIAAAAASAVANLMLTPPGSAQTKTFSLTASGWYDPGNWTPLGIPTSNDIALINGGTSDMSLDADLAIAGIVYDSSDSRTLGNASTGSIDATLTLTNTPNSGTGTPAFITVNQGTFTMAGNNIDPTGVGTARLGLKISNSGAWSVASGAKLNIGLHVSDVAGQQNSLTVTGGGTAKVRGVVTVYDFYGEQGLVHIDGPGGAITSPTIRIGGPAIIWRDLGDAGFLNDRIGDTSAIEMTGGTLQLTGAAGMGETEDMGQLRLIGGRKSKTYQVKSDSDIVARFAGLQRDVNDNGLMEFTATNGGSVHVTALAQGTEWNVGDWAIFNGADWAERTASGQVQAFTNYVVAPNGNSWTPSDNVLVNDVVDVTQHVVVNSIKFGGGGPPGGKAVILSSGATLSVTGMLVTENAAINGAGYVSGGGKAQGQMGQKAKAWMVNNAALTVTVPVVDNAFGPVELITGGGGTFVLNAPGQHTGGTYIGHGTFRAGASASLAGGVVDLDRDGFLDVVAGTSALPLGGLTGEGEVQLARGIIVTKGAGGTGTSASFSGRITGIGTVDVGPDTTLLLTGESDFTGDLRISGTTALGDGNGRINRISGKTKVRGGGSLILHNAQRVNTDRLNDGEGIELEGGTFEMVAGATHVTENVGVLTLRDACNNKIRVGGEAAANHGTIRFTGSDFEGFATADFHTDNASSSIEFVAAPAMTAGIISPGITFNSDDYATVTPAGVVSAYAGYNNSNDPTTWGPNDNVNVSGSFQISSDRTVNTLRVASNVIAGFGEVEYSLMRTNGILAAGSGADSIGGTGAISSKNTGNVTVIVVDDLASQPRLTLSLPIVDTPEGDPVSLVKSGPGTLMLNAPSSYTGDTYVNEGTLRAGQFANLIDSMLNLADDGVFMVDAGPTPLPIGGLTGGGDVQMARGIIANKPGGMGGTSAGRFSGQIDGTGSFTVAPAASLSLTEGAGVHVQTNLSDSTIDVRFGTGLGKTDITDVQVVYSAPGGNRITSTNGIEKAGRLAIGTLTHDPASSLHFAVGANTDVVIDNAPPLVNGILGGGVTVTQNGQSDFATTASVIHNGKAWEKVDNTDSTVLPADPNLWTSSFTNGRYVLRAGVPLRVDASLNSFKLEGDATGPATIAMQDGATLALTSGGLLAANQSGHAIVGNGKLTSNAGWLYTHVPDAAHTFTIGVDIADDATTGSIGLIKAGEGTLALTGKKYATGDTVVHNGIIYLAGLNVLPAGNVSIGPPATLRVGANNTINSVNGAGAIDVDAGATLAIKQQTPGTIHVMKGNGDILKLGPATLRGSGTTPLAGSLRVGEGTFELDGDGSINSVSSIRLVAKTPTAIPTLTILPPSTVGRVSDTAPITLAGGVLEVISGQTQFTEDVGPITLGGGANVIRVVGTAVDSTTGRVRMSSLNGFESLTRILDFQMGSGGSPPLVDGAPPVLLATAPALDHGILGAWATVNGGDWATVEPDPSGTGYRVAKIGGYAGGTDTALWTDQNVEMTGDVTAAAGTTASPNTLKIRQAAASSPNLVLPPGSLLATKGILFDGDGIEIEGDGALTAKSSGGGYVTQLRLRRDAARITVPIVDNGANPVTVAVSGAGRLTLDAASAYTGQTVINSGTLELGAAGDISSSGGVTVESTATFDAGPVSKRIGSVSGSGIMTIRTSTRLTSASDDSTSFTGSITGGGSFEKSGEGTLTLGGVSSMTGTFGVTGGDVILRDDASLEGAAKYILTDGASMVVEYRNGDDPITHKRLSAAAPIFTGAGTLALRFVDGGAASPPIDVPLGPLTITDGANRTGFKGSKVTFGGGTTSLQRWSGTICFNFEDGSASAAFASPPPLTLGLIGAWATVNEGSDWATVGSNGQILPYAGYVDSNNPATWAATQNVRVDGDFTLNANATANTIKLSSTFVPLTGTIAAGRTLHVPAGVLHAGQTYSKIVGGQFSGGPGTVVLNIADAKGTLELQTRIVDSPGGATALLKAGLGTLVLSSNNTFTGGVTVTDGTLKLVAGGQLSGGGIVDLDEDGNLDIVAASKSVGGLSGDGSVLLGTRTLFVGSNNLDTTFSGEISGSGGVTKVGGGAWILLGQRATLYTGLTTVSQGTLELRNLQRLGGDILIHGDSTLRLDDGIDLEPETGILLGDGAPKIEVAEGKTATIRGGITEPGPDVGLRKTGRGRLVLVSGSYGTGSFYSGPTDVLEGTLETSSPDDLGDGSASNSIILHPGGSVVYKGTWDSPSKDLLVVPFIVDRDPPVLDAKVQVGLGNVANTGADARLVKTGASSMTVNHARLARLAVNEGIFRVRPNGTTTGVSVLDQLDIATAAQFDLTDNAMIVRNMPLGAGISGTTNRYTGVTGLIQNGQNSGTWDGLGGITTSMPDAATGLTSVGVANAESVGYAGGTFRGISLSATDIILMYTYTGDANLDGFISGDDYAAIDFNIAVPGAAGWSNGDFNYDGIISGDDYASIDFNIVAQGAPFAVSGSADSSGVTAVPEPAGFGVVATVIAGTVLGRRRRASR